MALIPASVGPRLEGGDVLLIKGREYRVKVLLRSKVSVCELHRFAPKDFQVKAAQRQSPPLCLSLHLHASSGDCAVRAGAPV